MKERKRERAGEGRMKQCFCVRKAQHDPARPGHRYTIRAKVGIRNEKRRKEKSKKGETKRKRGGGEEAGEGLRVRSLFRSFINPPP